MSEKRTAFWFAVFAGAVAWIGVLLQLYLSISSSLVAGRTIAEGLISYLGYFTVLTNILVALVLSIPIVSSASAPGRFFHRPGVETATAAAIALVCVAYHLLLRHIWNPQSWQLLADVLLHYVTPILYLAYWWVAVPKRKLRWWHVAAWTSYPAGYVAYMLIRGELTGLYPYYFLDVDALGYTKSLTNALGVFAGFVFIALGLLVAGHLQSRHVS